MREPASKLLLGLLGVMLMGGCSTMTPGNATPAGTGTSEVSSPQSQSSEPNSDELPTDGAPKVENPIDTSRFQQDACLSLTTTQSQQLSLGATGTPVDMPLGNACEWRNPETRGNVQIGFLDKDPRGLSAEYKSEKAGRLKVFIELPPVDGHPAVVRGAIDDRENGACTVVVGASDEIAFEVALQLSRTNVGKKDPCKVSADVAGMALQTMKQG